MSTMFGTIACEKDTFPVVAFLSQNKLFLVETSYKGSTSVHACLEQQLK